MKKILFIILSVATSIIGVAQDGVGDWVIDPANGNDSNLGTYASPFKTMQAGINVALPGDTVFVRGGDFYSYAIPQIFPSQGYGSSGTKENYIVYMSWPGEWAKFNCQYHCDSLPDNPFGGVYNGAFSIYQAQYIKLKDLEFYNVFQCDSVIDGAISSNGINLEFEHIIIHDIGQRGFYHQSTNWRYDIDSLTEPWCGWGAIDTTRWINCDAYNLCDTFATSPGNSADAWKLGAYEDSYLYWEGCRAWNYTDDGWDPSALSGAKRIFKNCRAMAGHKYDDIVWEQAERNGWKCGGPNTDYSPRYSSDIQYVEMYNCLAYDCAGSGISFLDHSGYNRNNAYIYNNTVYRCGIGFFSFPTTVGARTDRYVNNIAWGSTGINSVGNPYEVYLEGDNYYLYNSTWIYNDGYPYWYYSTDYTLSYQMFNDTTQANIIADFTAPRNTDGSLQPMTTLALAPTSDLIDGGIDVGLPYSGTAPDLGAIEFGDSELTAMFNYSPISPEINQTVSFDGSLSWPTDTTTITSWSWDFGDSSGGSGETTTHSYSTANTYTVTLTVIDSQNNTDQYSVNVVVSDPEPSGEITTIAELNTAQLTALPGDTLFLSANSFTGDITISVDGQQNDSIYIMPTNGFAPLFSGTFTVTGDYINLRGITFNSLELSDPIGTYVRNCSFNGSGILLSIDLPPTYRHGISIDYNTHAPSNTSIYIYKNKQYNWSEYMMRVFGEGFDIHSTFNQQ